MAENELNQIKESIVDVANVAKSAMQFNTATIMKALQQNYLGVSDETTKTHSFIEGVKLQHDLAQNGQNLTNFETNVMHPIGGNIDSSNEHIAALDRPNTRQISQPLKNRLNDVKSEYFEQQDKMHKLREMQMQAVLNSKHTAHEVGRQMEEGNAAATLAVQHAQITELRKNIERLEINTKPLLYKSNTLVLETETAVKASGVQISTAPTPTLPNQEKPS